MFHWPFSTKPRIGDARAAAALFASMWKGQGLEQLGMAHLDAELRLLKISVARGTFDVVELPLRTLVRDALILGSHGLLIAHTHPGAGPDPSLADKAATRRLVDIVHPLGIRVVDHLVFARDGIVSFRDLGLL